MKKKHRKTIQLAQNEIQIPIPNLQGNLPVYSFLPLPLIPIWLIVFLDILKHTSTKTDLLTIPNTPGSIFSSVLLHRLPPSTNSLLLCPSFHLKQHLKKKNVFLIYIIIWPQSSGLEYPTSLIHKAIWVIFFNT